MKSKHDKHHRFTFKHAERNCYNCGRGGPVILCNSPGLAVHCYMRHYKWWVPERKQAKRNDPSRVVMVKGNSVGFSSYFGAPWTEEDKRRLSACLKECLPVVMPDHKALLMSLNPEAHSG